MRGGRAKLFRPKVLVSLYLCAISLLKRQVLLLNEALGNFAMESHASSLVGSSSNDGINAAEPPVITPGWVNGNRARRYFSNPFIDAVVGKLFPDQRRHPRFFAPPIVAYLGNVGSSKLFPIVNVSVGGFCLRANEFWTPGVVMPITLQRWKTIPQDDPESITVQAMLVRREGDAAGFAIALAAEESILFPHMRMQRASDLQSKIIEFLKDLPAPAITTAPPSIHPAMSANVVRKAERLEKLLDRAKTLSEGSLAWWGDGEQDAVAGKNSR